MIKQLNQFYLRQFFLPHFFSVFLNPFFLLRLPLYNHIKKVVPTLKGKILDFGCGSKPYQQLFTNAQTYIGVDIQNEGHSHAKENIDVYYDGHKLPFEDEFFDSIFTTEVLEHVFNLEEIMSELSRVLKHDGYFLLTLPFIWSEHEVPNDFARYTSFGLKFLLEKHGFEIISMEKSGRSIAVFFQLWISYFITKMAKINISKYLKAFLIMCFITPFNILGLFFSYVLPNDDTIYFNNVFLVLKK